MSVLLLLIKIADGGKTNGGKLMGCLHDPANFQQTSSKCIQNKFSHVLMLDVCWKFDKSLLDVCWIV